MSSPAPDAIRAARTRAGHTQAAAGAVIDYSLRAWQACESGERNMPATVWTLYLLRTGQHPTHRLVRRRATAPDS